MKKLTLRKAFSTGKGKAASRAAAAKKSLAGKGASLSVAKKERSITKKDGTRKSAAKKLVPKTVDEYIAAAPGPARDALRTMRQAIRSVVPPEATEIISYKIPAFHHKRVLVWYAAFGRHCSLFPTKAVLQEFKDQLQTFTTSKGTIQFPLDKPLPSALIKKLVRARLAHQTKKET